MPLIHQFTPRFSAIFCMILSPCRTAVLAPTRTIFLPENLPSFLMVTSFVNMTISALLISEGVSSFSMPVAPCVSTLISQPFFRAAISKIQRPCRYVRRPSGRQLLQPESSSCLPFCLLLCCGNAGGQAWHIKAFGLVLNHVLNFIHHIAFWLNAE